MIATESVIQETKAAAADKSLISPRFYVTDYKKMNALRFDHMAEAFKAMHKRFADDPNKHFFKRDDDPDFEQDFSHLPPSFKDFLIRGCLGEFSGALLYKEIADRIEDPILSDTYRLMARDEGRHSGFIRLAMRDINADLDLQMLQGEKEFVSMHPKIILYTTYLSEVIGYFRYINIYSHLEAHPEYRYHPIFKYFGGWCQDELKHGDFIGLQLEAQKNIYLDGGINRLLIRFFSLAVYVTMWLRDLKAQDFYASIGLNWREYDLKVIRETNAYAQRVFGLRLDVDNPKFIRILDRMAARYTEMTKREAEGAGKLSLLPLQAAMTIDYLRLFAMKVRTDAPPPIPEYPVAPVIKGFASKYKGQPAMGLRAISMPTVLGIAILGSGRVARARLRELHERYDTRVAVVASHDFNRAYELAFPIAAAATEDWEEAIARPDVDAVMVCSTNPHHARMAQAAIAAGKPVSVDYPLALTLADAEQLVEQARARGVVLHVEHIELLSAWFEAFRKALPRIGRIHHITWNNLSSRPATPEDWTFDRAHGFSLFQQASVPSRIVACVGQITWIEGEETFSDEQGTRFGRRATHLRFGFGAEGRGDINDVLTRHEETGPAAELQAVGESGTLIGRQHREVWYTNPEGATESVPVMPRSGLFAHDIAAFLDAIAGRGTPYVSLDHVLEALRFADAAERAVKSGQRVTLTSD